MATDLAPTNDLEPLEHAYWTPEQIQTTLTALALNGGNARRTANQLQQNGLEISHDTVLRFRNDYFPNRYAYICENHAERIEESVLHQAREAAILAAHTEHTLLTRLHDEAAHLDRKDLGAALKNVSTTKGINIDKFLSRPPTVVEHRTADHHINRLASLGLVVDSTGTEITDANEVETQALEQGNPPLIRQSA